MLLVAIEPRRLYRQVADQLRGLIDAGEYRIGDRLPTERELSERLGISRPTVREALIALEVEGRIRIRVGSGIYVAALERRAKETPAEIDGPFEVLRARELIEGAVAAAAAEVVETDHLRLLDEVLGRMENGGHPSKETIALDRLFHVTVAGIVGNPVTTHIVGDLFDKRMSPYFERLSGYFENQQSWRLAAAEHRAVRDAIASGDGIAASEAMRTHLARSQTRFQIGFGEPERERGGSGSTGAASETASEQRSIGIKGRKRNADEKLADRRRTRRARPGADGRLGPGDEA